MTLIQAFSILLAFVLTTTSVVTPVYAVDGFGQPFSEDLQRPNTPIQVHVDGEHGPVVSLSIELFEDDEHLRRFLEKFREQTKVDSGARLTSISLSKDHVHSVTRFQQDIEAEFGVHTIPITWDPDRKQKWLDGRQKYHETTKVWRQREERFLNAFQNESWWSRVFRSDAYRERFTVGLRAIVNGTMAGFIFHFTGEYSPVQAFIMGTYLGFLGVLDQFYSDYVFAMGIRKGYNPLSAFGLFGRKKISLDETESLPKRKELEQYEFYMWLDAAILSSVTVLGQGMKWLSDPSFGNGWAETLSQLQQGPPAEIALGSDPLSMESLVSIFEVAGQTMTDQLFTSTSVGAELMGSLCLTNPFLCSGLAVIGVGYFAKKYRAALGRFKDHIRRYVGASVLGTNAVAAAIGSIAQQGHYDRFIVSSADRLKHATVRMNLKGYQKRRAEQVISSYKKTLLMTSSLVNTPLAHLANLDRGLLDQYGMKWMNTLGYTALAFLGVLGWGFARKAERLSVIPDVKGAMRSASDWAQEKIKGLSPHRRRQRRCVAVFN